MPLDPADLHARQLDPEAVRGALARLMRDAHAPWLHGEVARRMADKLPLIRYRPELILDWWSSLGAGSAALDVAYPKARRVQVEPNTAWATRAQRRAHRPLWSPRRWRSGPVDTVVEADDIEGEAGLVWANMMLHAVVDPLALFRRWHGLLRTDGFVMFSCLGPGTLRELRTLYARLDWPAPTPGFIDMHDLGDMLVQTGFADPVMDQETLTLRWANARALLAELRGLGGNTAPQRVAGLRTPRWRALLERELESLAASDGSLGLSFEVAYGHAFKAPPRTQTGGTTTVSLDAMRTMVRARHGPPKESQALR